MNFDKNFEVELKCLSDNAWYAGTIESTSRGLKINYGGFEYYEEYFTKMDEIKERIRLKSIQVQDEDCDAVVEGKIYCVYNKEKHTTKYFDAEVIKVHRTCHEKRKDVENCKCKFDIKFHDESLKCLKKKVNVNHVCVINTQDNEQLISKHYEIKKFLKFFLPRIQLKIKMTIKLGNKRKRKRKIMKKKKEE